MHLSHDSLPDLVEWHQAWRQGDPAAAFASNVSRRYDLSTLVLLLRRGEAVTRRAAVTALGMLADDRWSRHVAERLNDPSRAVRYEAERWIGRLWDRITPRWRCHELTALRRQIIVAPRAVLSRLETWERIATRHAVVWELRGEALVQLRHEEEAAECYRIAWQLDTFRYRALCAHARLLRRARRIGAALGLYRRALQVFPDLLQIRSEVARLERATH